MVDEASLLSKYDGPTSFKGKVSFKGGIRQMIKARRLRCERGSVPPPDHCDEPVSTPDGPLGGSTLLGGLKGAVPMGQRVECAHPLSWSFPIDKDGPRSHAAGSEPRGDESSCRRGGPVQVRGVAYFFGL